MFRTLYRDVKFGAFWGFSSHYFPYEKNINFAHNQYAIVFVQTEDATTQVIKENEMRITKPFGKLSIDQEFFLGREDSLVHLKKSPTTYCNTADQRIHDMPAALHVWITQKTKTIALQEAFDDEIEEFEAWGESWSLGEELPPLWSYGVADVRMFQAICRKDHKDYALIGTNSISVPDDGMIPLKKLTLGQEFEYEGTKYRFIDGGSDYNALNLETNTLDAFCEDQRVKLLS